MHIYIFISQEIYIYPTKNFERGTRWKSIEIVLSAAFVNHSWFSEHESIQFMKSWFTKGCIFAISDLKCFFQEGTETNVSRKRKARTRSPWNATADSAATAVQHLTKLKSTKPVVIHWEQGGFLFQVYFISWAVPSLHLTASLQLKIDGGIMMC